MDNLTESVKPIGSLTLKQRTLPELSLACVGPKEKHSLPRGQSAITQGNSQIPKRVGLTLRGGASAWACSEPEGRGDQNQIGGARPEGVQSLKRLRRGSAGLALLCGSDLTLASTGSSVLRQSLLWGPRPGSTMNRCAEAAAVAATVPGAGVRIAGPRPPIVPRQASFFPPPVPNPFVQQTRLSAARRIQVRGEGQKAEKDPGEGRGSERGAQPSEGHASERGGVSR